MRLKNKKKNFLFSDVHVREKSFSTYSTTRLSKEDEEKKKILHPKNYFKSEFKADKIFWCKVKIIKKKFYRGNKQKKSLA